MKVEETEEIKREFQLERMILFSDAVFAIIITIMVLEIKLPEGLRHASSEAVREAFLEVLPKFGGYATSFAIVAVFWSKHLELFSYLKDYTKKLIAFNMVFLFFISLFPFSITLLTGALSVGNAYGFLFYFFVILMALFTQTLLIGYLVRNAQTLCIKPAEIEHNLQWKAQRINLFTIPILFVYVIIGFLVEASPLIYSYGIMAWAISQPIIRKKLYPKEPNADKPLLARLFKSRKRKPLPGN
nr:TMEM175 family protein [uncultured Mucilaginibacter sp.]